MQSVRVELEAGEHEFEALVWLITEPDGSCKNESGVGPPMAQVSWRGGFLFFVEEGDRTLFNTGEASWWVEDLTDAVKLRRPRLVGYHDIGPTFSIDLDRWEEGEIREPEIVRPPIKNTHGVRRPGWCLYPAEIPEQRRRMWIGGRIRAVRHDWSEGPWADSECVAPELAGWQHLLDEGVPLIVPPATTVTVLWDFENYVCGYPCFELEGDGSAEVLWSWAEAHYLAADPEVVTGSSGKGHRDEVVNKVFLGIEDVWRSEEWKCGKIPALWWRSGRFARIRVRSGGTPLTIKSLGVIETGFPLGDASPWKSSDPVWDRLMSLFESSLRASGHETWTDSPYYEQMSYVGDTALTCLASYALFEDTRLSRRAIQLFNWSRRASGLVAERYPCGWRQESPTYALLWPMMVRDYAWWQDEPEFVRTQLAGLRALMAEFEALVGEDEHLHQLPGWPFVDWVSEWEEGCGPGVREGDSSIVNLHWVLALLATAQVEDYCGDALLADRGRRMARRVFHRVVERYWDAERGQILDTVGCEQASEHAQAFALLTGLLDAQKSAACLSRLRDGRGLVRATIYGSFYVLEALYRQGAGEEFHAHLEGWRSLADRGFTATPERPEPTRSDCHAWGAHPAWHSFASIAGVRPAAPGFARVRIEPRLGPLKFVACGVRHPEGIIEVDLQFDDGKMTGSIILPTGLTGECVLGSQIHSLYPGFNKVGH